MQRTLSTSSAIIFNLHIILGGGFFIAAQELKEFGILFSCAMWVLGALLFFPMTKIFAQLSEKFPVVGGIYAYPREAFGKPLAQVLGIIFFIGVAFGNSAIINYFIKAFNCAINFNQCTAPTYWILICSLILALAFLSVSGNKFLAFVEHLISASKIIAVIIIAALALVFFSSCPLLKVHNWVSAIGKSLLYTAFAYVGIEACCSIADQVQNIKRVTYLSLLFSVVFYVILQAMICVMKFDVCAWSHGVSQGYYQSIANLGFTFAILSSYLGSLYGGFLSNNWNLFAIAKDALPNQAAPDRQLFYFCAILQALMVFAGLFIPKVLALSVFMTLIVYSVVVAAYFKIFQAERPILIVALAFLSLVIMGYGCLAA